MKIYYYEGDVSLINIYLGMGYVSTSVFSSSSSSLNYSLQSVQRINLQERIEITIRGRGRFQNIDETREDVLRRLFE